MLYLHLDPGFKPFQDKIIKFNTFKFPAGELHIKDIVLPATRSKEVTITHRIKNSDDLMLILLAKDALSNMGMEKINLFIPYLPYARQDRRTAYSEPLSIKVFTTIINNANFNSVSILDPHSDISTALLDRCYTIGNCSYVHFSINKINEVYSFHTEKKPYMISPDAGAHKKVTSYASKFRHMISGLIKCDKTRDTVTGKLSGFDVYTDNLQGKPCLIIDDICDGGGTFIGLAEKLKKKNAGSLYLYVTHGIFSNGFDELSKHFIKIFTTNSYQNIDNPLIKQLEL